MQIFSAMDSQCVGRGTKIKTVRDEAIVGKARIKNCWKACPRSLLYKNVVYT